MSWKPQDTHHDYPNGLLHYCFRFHCLNISLTEDGQHLRLMIYPDEYPEEIEWAEVPVKDFQDAGILYPAHEEGSRARRGGGG